MNIQLIRLFLSFYYKALLTGIVFSIAILMLVNFYVSLVFFISLGWLPYFLYLIYFKSRELYFYFNKSITKTQLLLFTILLNFVVGCITKMFYNVL